MDDVFNQSVGTIGSMPSGFYGGKDSHCFIVLDCPKSAFQPLTTIVFFFVNGELIGVHGLAIDWAHLGSSIDIFVVLQPVG